MIKCSYSVTCDIVRLVISEVTKLSSGSDGRNRDRASRGWCSDKVRHTLFRNKFMTCNPSVRRHWVFDKKTSNPSSYWKIQPNKKHAQYKLTVTNFCTLVSCTPATNWPPASKNHRRLGQAASCGTDGAGRWGAPTKLPDVKIWRPTSPRRWTRGVADRKTASRLISRFSKNWQKINAKHPGRQSIHTIRKTFHHREAGQIQCCIC